MFKTQKCCHCNKSSLEFDLCKFTKNLKWMQSTCTSHFRCKKYTSKEKTKKSSFCKKSGTGHKYHRKGNCCVQMHLEELCFRIWHIVTQIISIVCIFMLRYVIWRIMRVEFHGTSTVGFIRFLYIYIYINTVVNLIFKTFCCHDSPTK